MNVTGIFVRFGCAASVLILFSCTQAPEGLEEQQTPELQRERLPEYYGLYAMDKNTLAELPEPTSAEFKSSPPQDFSGEVYFILFRKDVGQLVGNLSLRGYTADNMLLDPTKADTPKQWPSFTIRAQPVEGQEEMVRLVPSVELSPGVYALRATSALELQVTGSVFSINATELMRRIASGVEDACEDHNWERAVALQALLDAEAGAEALNAIEDAIRKEVLASLNAKDWARTTGVLQDYKNHLPIENQPSGFYDLTSDAFNRLSEEAAALIDNEQFDDVLRVVGIANHWAEAFGISNREACRKLVDARIQALFEENPDGTVTDRSTGLVWTSDGTTTMSADASSYGYIPLQEAGDQLDWDIPSLEQLRHVLSRVLLTEDALGRAFVHPIAMNGVMSTRRGPFWLDHPQARDPIREWRDTTPFYFLNYLDLEANKLTPLNALGYPNLVENYRLQDYARPILLMYRRENAAWMKPSETVAWKPIAASTLDTKIGGEDSYRKMRAKHPGVVWAYQVTLSPGQTSPRFAHTWWVPSVLGEGTVARRSTYVHFGNETKMNQTVKMIQAGKVYEGAITDLLRNIDYGTGYLDVQFHFPASGVGEQSIFVALFSTSTTGATYAPYWLHPSEPIPIGTKKGGVPVLTEPDVSTELSNTQLSLVARFNIAGEGFMNSNVPRESWLRSTSLKLDEADWYTLDEVVYPAPTTIDTDFAGKMSVYQNRFAIEAKLRLTGEPQSDVISGTLQYQGGNARGMLQPSSIKIRFPLSVDNLRDEAGAEAASSNVGSENAGVLNVPTLQSGLYEGVWTTTRGKEAHFTLYLRIHDDKRIRAVGRADGWTCWELFEGAALFDQIKLVGIDVLQHQRPREEYVLDTLSLDIEEDGSLAGSWGDTTNSGAVALSFVRENRPSDEFDSLLHSIEADVVDLEQEVWDFLERHAEALSAENVDRIVRFYGDEVEYYGAGKVDRAFIRNDKNAYYKKWVSADFTLTGPRLAVSMPGNLTWVQFVGDFRVSTEGAEQTRTGRTLNTMQLARFDDAFYIVSESQKLLDD